MLAKAARNTYNKRMSFIELNAVKFTYNSGERDEAVALDGVSLSIGAGEFVAVVGHNGSGKSTLAKLINGLYEPDEGEILVDGLSTADDKNLFDIRSRVGVVFQNPDNQMVATIIEDDIAFGPENLGLPPAEIRARVDWALAGVGMSEYAKGMPFKLSGGQKQRVAIAGVLALKPRVMILDESTSMLDPKGREEVMRVVKKLVDEEKMTVILITHFMEEAMQCGRIVVLKEGKVFLDGGREILTREAELKEAGLETPFAVRMANALRARGIGIDADVMTLPALVEALCR
ncbi:MAG: energy-coupling factor transporter ATPase [Clostridiales bacterium]|jgi:energy-coupling factor transport system ATP-binding protein|nr:energy-coupling factor transporter ATPase [Clostridiales bacterium]